MLDQFGRTINYMRVSVTDRCNLRCRYCMPDGVKLVAMKDILTYEEILEICGAAAGLGISRIKITGGEPLARLGCADLIASLKQVPGIEQVTMTTNGVLLGKYLPELLAAGLDAVNISLDTLDSDRFLEITGRDELENVLESLDAALSTRLRVKINTVLQQGMNDDEWLPLAELAQDKPLDVRFIEMMPIGYGKGITGISNGMLKIKLEEKFPELSEDPSVHGNGPAVYVRIPGWRGSIGFISAIHGKFCDHCNRVRLTSQGRLKPCLCFGETTDLLPILRSGADKAARKEALTAALREGIFHKPRQHSFEDPASITEQAVMASIGG
ncbi:MAG: GTP 3',8-cyclase MoaA [Lachnospiraceae bacterium]|nr:GTP 3',8-cyclase MoaA [Lachnospiraceae bacterium]